MDKINRPDIALVHHMFRHPAIVNRKGILSERSVKPESRVLRNERKPDVVYIGVKMNNRFP